MSSPAAAFLRRHAPIPGAAATSGSQCVRKQYSAGTLLSIDTDDFDEFMEYAQGWDIDYQLTGAKRPRSTISGVFTSSLQIALVRHAMGYCAQGCNPQGFLSIVLPIDQNPMLYRGALIDGLEIALIGADYESVCASGSHFWAVSVAEERLERYTVEVGHRPQLWRGSGDRLRFWNSPHQLHCLDSLMRILTAVRAYPTLLKEQQNAALIEEKILENLPLEAGLASPLKEDRARYKLARKAYRYLQDRIEEVPSISNLCVATGASYATLERSFREIYGMTPKTLMQELRLSRARSALLHPSPTTTVTAVALRFGFIELGRFSVRYRERFGETPSETLGRVRGNSERIAPLAVSGPRK